MSALDPLCYLYTPEDELALHQLHQRNAHLVLCCCAEYVKNRQDRLLTNRWEKVRQLAGTDQKAAKRPFFGGSNDKGRQWEQHPASANALSVQLGERRGLVGIVPATIGTIVFDADSDLATDAARLAELLGDTGKAELVAPGLENSSRAEDPTRPATSGQYPKFRPA